MILQRIRLAKVLVGAAVLLGAGVGLCAQGAATYTFEYSSSGIPIKVSGTNKAMVRLPGAVILGDVVSVRTPVVRPSAQSSGKTLANVTDYEAYSVVEVRTLRVLAGDAPELVKVFWQPHVRRVRGQAIYTIVVGRGARHQQPLLPGMKFLAYVAPNIEEKLGGRLDREPGLWDRIGPKWAIDEDESGQMLAFANARLDNDIAELLLEGGESVQSHRVLSNHFQLIGDSTTLEDAAQDLIAIHARDEAIWKQYQEFLDENQ